ncbi:hypothetical protein FACS1894151_04320 [Spirochaetia bacterium]|nr:hypothetical protein FACS1894151_04320 [Spirochaetia bacterium]
MLVIDGFFDNSNRFIPDRPIIIPQNKKVVVTIEEENVMLEKQITVFAEARKMLDDSADEILPDDFPQKVKWFRPTEQ